MDQLRGEMGIGHNSLVYVGDGSSDVHVMLHVNRLDGLTIAVSENKYITQIARRTILSEDAFSMLVPILEEIVGWNSSRFAPFLKRTASCCRSGTRSGPTPLSYGRPHSPAALPRPLPISDRENRMPLDMIGWLATTLSISSYFCREPITLRRVQAVASAIWIAYGLVIHSWPLIGANVLTATAAVWSSIATVRRARMAEEWSSLFGSV